MPEEPANLETIPLSRVDAKTGNVATLAMTAWLDVLRAALPPGGVLLVGAGTGEGAWVRWLRDRGVASGTLPVYLVEGDERQYRHLHSIGDGCILWRDVVAPRAGAATFHLASNPAESGLLPAQSLQKLWPHLGTERAVAIEDATTLDGLHTEAAGRINWLVLDCLPAAALLQGGANLLPQLDVALVRVAGDLPPELLADQHAVDQLLQAAGLRRIHSQVERHPGLAHALYVRDAAYQLKALEPAQKEWPEQARKELQAQAEESAAQLKQAQEAWAKEKAELAQFQLQAKQASDQAQKELQGQAEKSAVQLKQAQEAWAKERAELAQAQDAAVRSASQAQGEAQALTQKAEKQLQQAQAQVQRLTATCDQSARQVGEQQVRVRALEQQIRELKIRETETQASTQALQAEFAKAQGQLEVIKQLLLGDMGRG